MRSNCWAKPGLSPAAWVFNRKSPARVACLETFSPARPVVSDQEDPDQPRHSVIIKGGEDMISVVPVFLRPASVRRLCIDDKGKTLVDHLFKPVGDAQASFDDQVRKIEKKIEGCRHGSIVKGRMLVR